MFVHGPSCLSGPVTRGRGWWPRATPADDRPIRADLVARVRREIAAGTYDTPEKLDAALERLLDRLEGDA
jgi:negative regulator of flagellin synthesis FlgM